MAQREVVICEPVRTPVGRFMGLLSHVPAVDLAEQTIRALLEKSDLDPEVVDDLILGQCNPSGEAPAIGRVAALNAGLPISTPGSQVDRRCGSGLMAVLIAAMQVETSVSELIIAGGVESMSQTEHYIVNLRGAGPKNGPIVLQDRLLRARETVGGKHHVVTGGMIETAENLRRQYRISRLEQDQLAYESHRRALAAQQEGRFRSEIVSVVAANARHEETVVNEDEHPRPETNLEALSLLTPIMTHVDPEATVTAGNSSGQNDGAAMCIVTTRSTADRLGLRALARLVTWSVGGVSPELMGIGPVAATQRVLERAGITLDDVDLIECNEAFAAQVLAVTREWGFGAADFDRLNVNGSGISLGHPVGATGARILATLLYEMQRRGARLGIETMCIGGGQGLAALFERIETRP